MFDCINSIFFKTVLTKNLFHSSDNSHVMEVDEVVVLDYTQMKIENDPQRGAYLLSP